MCKVGCVLNQSTVLMLTLLSIIKNNSINTVIIIIKSLFNKRLTFSNTFITIELQ